ncbi:hypothetical protein ACFORH_06700 [Amycolatopsis roodepoortensis]|uniref:Uncharacterized protein n=1 Tax=Amycolatopsis roodepoortensis TaxID=700274 RepID=A0ABR9L952_9PSEU|nr:hypothetical protein [Amycolatopsis roodepoortensis]MBE1576703.1 hypothetical protein [Amycolatopsis roodepoortensis]
MTDLAAQPGVIPYVDNHDGPRRLLTIDIPLVRHAQIFAPLASIDGRQYVVSWGAVMFEIPADRNVHVSVHLHTNYTGRAGDTSTQFASIVLAPHAAPVRLAAQFPSNGEGSLLPVG